MRAAAFNILLAVMCCSAAAAPSSASAQDPAEITRRINASLALPVHLAPPEYLTVVVTLKRPSPYERCTDPATYPYGETGIWRQRALISVEVLALVITDAWQPHILVLDNFAFPRLQEGRIDPSPLLRALRLR